MCWTSPSVWWLGLCLIWLVLPPPYSPTLVSAIRIFFIVMNCVSFTVMMLGRVLCASCLCCLCLLLLICCWMLLLLVWCGVCVIQRFGCIGVLFVVSYMYTSINLHMCWHCTHMCWHCTHMWHVCVCFDITG